MDANNHVVKLCAQGMRAEGAGLQNEAKALYEQAWKDHGTNYEACIAAHYLARQQGNVADELHWNQVALERATEADAQLVGGFLASLHLNLGHSQEKLGETSAARAHYRLAQRYLGEIADGPYKETIRGGVENALKRTRVGSDGRDQ